MVRPYSNDLRERVVSAVMAGESCRSMAMRLGVAVSSVVKWSRRYRRTGSVAWSCPSRGVWSRLRRGWSSTSFPACPFTNGWGH